MFKLLLLLYVTVNLIVGDAVHHCGINSLTTKLSEALSQKCDKEKLSEVCCKPHDTCYEQFDWLTKHPFAWNSAIHECDKELNQCIMEKCYSPEQTWCRNWIYYTHGKSTEYFNNFCAWTGNIFCNRF